MPQRRGQFVLTRNPSRLPPGWPVRHAAGWQLATCDLPVRDLRDADGHWRGWCLGYPVGEEVPGPTLAWADVDSFHAEHAGRFALFLPDDGMYLDAHGSLTAVYAGREPTIASVPSLLSAERDPELQAALGFPARDTWLPAGLTFSPGVHRLLANHKLDLARWQPIRHWSPPRPAAEADVMPVIRGVQRTLGALARRHPLAFCLTAGRDSRLLLACARPYLERAEFVTFSPGHETVDTHIAARIAAACGLRHRVLAIEHANAGQRQAWLDTTGHAVAGAILDLHPTLRHLDPQRPLLPGVAGEVGRAFYWTRHDTPQTRLDARDLLARLHLPAHPRLVETMGAWIADAGPVDALQLLDLAYIEQRLSCWSAPQHHGNPWSLFELAPLSGRGVFTAMLRLPAAYRFGQRLFEDICRREWPELLTFPVNEFTGIKGRLFSAARRTKQALRELAA